MLAGLPTVVVTRGTRIESVHAVAACACDDDGKVVLAHGDIETPVFLRSSAKPFIAAAVVASGAAERFGFDDRALALMAASHGGEPDHAATAAAMLERIGARVDDLQCGAHPPAYEPAAAALAARGEKPSALHNNCSGKHAGILALARMLDAPFASYLEPDHPAQRAILALCERLSEDRFAGNRLGVDGCGIPVYATPLRNAARSYARFATLEGVDDADAEALLRVRTAMAREPWFVAGTGRFDSELIRATGGRIVGKAGAEGVHADALRATGVGLALKVIDGNRRAMPVATLAALDALGALEPAEREALAGHARPAIKNVAGRVVGEIRALEDFGR